jgi:hypothetical protein
MRSFLESATLNTSIREQNHHQFKKADDAPQKNIKQTVLIEKENKLKLRYAVVKFLVKYNISAAGVLSSDMAV